jgi:hypothetical protein
VTLNATNFSSAAFDNDSVESFSASSVAVSSTTPGTFTLTIYAYYNSTTGLLRKHQTARIELPPAPSPWLLGGTGVTLAGVLLLGFPRKRNRWSALLVAVVTVGLLTTAGCTGATTATTTSSGGSSGNTNAPTGTSTFLVTATGVNSSGATITHSDTVTVTVQ